MVPVHSMLKKVLPERESPNNLFVNGGSLAGTAVAGAGVGISAPKKQHVELTYVLYVRSPVSCGDISFFFS